VAAGGLVPSTTTLNMNGGIFDLNGSTQTVARLEGFAGTITSATAGNLIVNQTTDTTLTAALNGLLALTKNGPGSLTLNAASTTAGTTTLNNGDLVVNASLSSSALAVNGGTLRGVGPLGTVNVAAGAIAPGTGPGTLASGNLALTAASTLRFELTLAGTPGGGSNDLISVTGNLTLDGTLAVTELPGFSEGIYRIFDYTGALTNNGLDLEAAFLLAHPGSFIDTTTAHQVNLVVIPEPQAAAWLAATLGLFLARRRR
jgi:fibronectin-binding autotransporter adhesin